MVKRPWSDFEQVLSKEPLARPVKPEELVALENSPSLRCCVAYAQEELVHDGNGKLKTVDAATYRAMARHERLNVFGLAYRRDAKLWLHENLAAIIKTAADILYRENGWTTVVYDGLRTVEGAYKLYQFATDDDIAAGLLALPGESAHNKGMAVDSMMIDAGGREVDMGGHFDHLDMETNSRAYMGDKISPQAKKNRLIREAAFLRSAFSQNLLIAPLRSEFWDDRPPENRADLWRVLDSAARCMGLTLYTPEDSALRRTDRAAWVKKWESWSYDDFLAKWQELFKGRDAELMEKFGAAHPPLTERIEFYHGNYHPIYDRDLKTSGKSLTE